uniref:PSD13 N-terminal domain-containing protein n=1 Tax=Cucumis melo TaxID=3656 RepID=A0A9I9E972_CUCME
MIGFADLAFDLSLFAFVGDNIYNIGELLGHPIILQMKLAPYNLFYMQKFKKEIVAGLSFEVTTKND